jgi:uncharacterized protein (TIGR03435 family)
MHAIKIAALLLALVPQVLQFEVASIRRSRSDGIREFQIQGDRLVISGMSVKDLVRRAYMASDAVQDESRVVGGPAWVSADLYDIVAQSDGNLGVDREGRPVRLLAMLKTLVENRFALRVRIEPRDTSLYELVVATRDGQPGAGMRRSTRDCPVYPQGMPRPPVDPAERCGLTTLATGSTVTVTAQAITMTELATRLQGFRSVDRPVHDHTGLEGRYDFTFDFTSTPIPAGTPVTAPAADTGASLFTEIQDRLGLKLQAARAPVDFYVIESVARPTEN